MELTTRLVIVFSGGFSGEIVSHRGYNGIIALLTLLCSGVGFSVGVIASVILFKRTSQFHEHPKHHPRFAPYKKLTGRGWPIALSTGFGAGAAYADCDRSFNPARIPGTRIIPASSSTEPSK